jgi:diguanylate cyclase (GGDEF)-like protein
MHEKNKQTILIVDDSRVSVRTLASIFKDEWQIKIALDGHEAIRIAESEQQPDIILLDVMMPGMDGYEICARLKESTLTRDIPVIFITSREESEDEERGLQLGAIDYVIKPVHPAIIKARVRNHLELKRLRDRLKEQTLVDGLTGLANRRRFDGQLNAEWHRAQRYGKALTVLMMDIDFFKKYNDSYGHLVGDDCLKAVAEAVRMQARRSPDLVARWGGEEFSCLLPDTDSAQALAIGDQMRASVEALHIPHKASEISNWVTISLGAVSHIPKAGQDVQKLIQLADQALYQAKHAGRNRIVASEWGQHDS